MSLLVNSGHVSRSLQGLRSEGQSWSMRHAFQRFASGILGHEGEAWTCSLLPPAVPFPSCPSTLPLSSSFTSSSYFPFHDLWLKQLITSPFCNPFVPFKFSLRFKKCYTCWCTHWHRARCSSQTHREQSSFCAHDNP